MNEPTFPIRDDSETRDLVIIGPTGLEGMPDLGGGTLNQSFDFWMPFYDLREVAGPKCPSRLDLGTRRVSFAGELGDHPHAALAVECQLPVGHEGPHGTVAEFVRTQVKHDDRPPLANHVFAITWTDETYE